MPRYLNKKHKINTHPMSGKFRQGSTRLFWTTFWRYFPLLLNLPLWITSRCRRWTFSLKRARFLDLFRGGIGLNCWDGRLLQISLLSKPCEFRTHSFKTVWRKMGTANITRSRQAIHWRRKGSSVGNWWRLTPSLLVLLQNITAQRLPGSLFFFGPVAVFFVLGGVFHKYRNGDLNVGNWFFFSYLCPKEKYCKRSEARVLSRQFYSRQVSHQSRELISNNLIRFLH